MESPIPMNVARGLTRGPRCTEFLHIRPVSVGLDSQIWYLFIYITGYLNVRKMSETIDFRTFVGPLGRIKHKAEF